MVDPNISTDGVKDSQNNCDVAANNDVAAIEDDPIEVRRAKRQALIDAGIDPYGHAFESTATAVELDDKYANLEDGATSPFL